MNTRINRKINLLTTEEEKKNIHKTDARENIMIF